MGLKGGPALNNGGGGGGFWTRGDLFGARGAGDGEETDVLVAGDCGASRNCLRALAVSIFRRSSSSPKLARVGIFEGAVTERAWLMRSLYVGDMGLSSSSMEKSPDSSGILRVILRLLRVGDSGSALV